MKEEEALAGASRDSLLERYNKSPSDSSKERRNPLNYEDKTLKWVKSTVKAALQKSDCSGEEILKAAEAGVKEADNDN